MRAGVKREPQGRSAVMCRKKGNINQNWKKKTRSAWCLKSQERLGTVALWEAEMVGSPEIRSSRPAWPT